MVLMDWQAFDALIHFVFEGSFLWYSTFGRTVNSGEGMFAVMCRSLTRSPLLSNFSLSY